jgi:hypothetical protein
MATQSSVRLIVSTSFSERVLWYLGWRPRPLNLLGLGLAVGGLLLFRHAAGLLLGLLALILRWKTASLINRTYGQLLCQAESRIKQEGAKRLGIAIDDSQCYVVAVGRGSAPIGVKTKPIHDISVVYICDVFFGIYTGASFRLSDTEIQLPATGEEIYFRHVSAVNYRDPLIEVVLSHGRATRQFTVGSVDSSSFLEALRAKLRASSLPSRAAAPREIVSQLLAQEADSARAAGDPPARTLPERAGPTMDDEERYCYLRSSRLSQLYADPTVLDALVEQLDVPGKLSVIRQLTEREKQEAIETQIDHFRRTPTSFWYGVPTYEVLAASIWRAEEFLRRRLIREIFSGVSQEEDLLHPVARWLSDRGHEPYMEVPLGRRRIDVLGYKKPAFAGSGWLTAVELKNEDAQFGRAIDQMGTFAEYAHVVYLACTPAFAAEHLERNAESRGVKHWDPKVLERKLTAGGFGLLIVERDLVFEVIKPVERVPSSANVANTVNGLTAVLRVEC